MLGPPVSPEVFEAILNVDIDKLSDLPESTLRSILPCLVRMSLCAPLNSSHRWMLERKKILKCLSGIEVVNNLVGLLSIDFHALEQDVKKEQQLRMKIGGNQTESVLISQLDQGLALAFEKSDPDRKLRLLLSELLFVMSQVRDGSTDLDVKQSELFESEVYLDEVSDVLSIAQAELPSLLPITKIAEALLHIQNGPWLLCRVVANVPNTFHQVCRSLISSGEEDGVEGRRRAEALQNLCHMCPSQPLPIRALCVENRRLPGLAVALTLHHGKAASADSNGPPEGGISDIVAFVSGLLLGSDVNIRNWFAQFLRAGQKKKDDRSMVYALRQELLSQLQTIAPAGSNQIPQDNVVQACAFIRLYCALKGIASIRLNEEETQVLLRLITCHPPATPAGVRFVSLGLCMLMACPYILSSPEQEKKAIDWIKWLLKQVGRFERLSGLSASFGEMLLLIAIHFHGNQNTAVADLVHSTLGMKSAVKANALARLKTIFTQEIFTEQVVTSHAVKVSVTSNLNASKTGYLPIHCIYQLLKSRAFSKHKVSIKDWIFRQICSSSVPLHPLIPPLIEVYVNSIIIPSTKTDRRNQPIAEDEILSVFKDSVLALSSKNETDIGEPMEVDSAESMKSKFTTQLLLVYYVLLYQDTLLSNMKTILAANRKVAGYTPHLLAQLPMKYLLQQAQKEQQLYAGLFSPLLRLLATHYPHLCLVEDWLDEELSAWLPKSAVITLPGLECTEESLAKAFDNVQKCPTQVLLFLEQLAAAEASRILQFADVLVGNLQKLLDPGVPRKVLDLVKTVWVKVNTIIPRKLRVMTVNALRPKRESAFKAIAYTEDDITVDPLIVLRCDEHVFRCGPLLEITLRTLTAFLQASRSYLASHLQAQVSAEVQAGATQGSVEMEELRSALVASQESAAVQLLLEACLPTDNSEKEGGLLCDLREIQCLICSHCHQMFIADPHLAKLVHFQGYPSDVLPVTVAGIPSMHICLDFIPELLSQPHLEKQIFAIELVSHLSLQYALPKSLSTAKLAINVMITLMTVLAKDTRPDFFQPLLPAVTRIARAFPTLSEDIISLLIQLGRVCNSHMAIIGNAVIDVAESEDFPLPKEGEVMPRKRTETPLNSLGKYAKLSNAIQRTFQEIISSAALIKHQPQT